MKALITILLALTIGCVQAIAQFGYQPERDDRFSNTLGFDVKNAFWGGKKNDQGIRRNPESFVFRGGASLNTDYWEFNLGLTIFDNIGYYSYDLGFHKEFITIPLNKDESTLAFLAGGLASIASRDRYPIFGDPDMHYFNYALSGKIRWDKPFNLPFYTQIDGAFTHRSDIKHIYGDNSNYSAWDNPSGYFTIGIYYLELFGYD